MAIVFGFHRSVRLIPAVSADGSCQDDSSAYMLPFSCISDFSVVHLFPIVYAVFQWLFLETWLENEAIETAERRHFSASGYS